MRNREGRGEKRNKKLTKILTFKNQTKKVKRFLKIEKKIERKRKTNPQRVEIIRKKSRIKKKSKIENKGNNNETRIFT